MTAPTETAEGTLSPWWRRTVIATMAFGFRRSDPAHGQAYQNAPPIPGGAVDPFGEGRLHRRRNRVGCQQVILKHGLMDNGTVWGHRAYLGPDFSAIPPTPRPRSHRSHRPAALRLPYAENSAEDRAAVEAVTAARLKENRYDPRSGTLKLLAGDAEFFDHAVAYWTRYFIDPAGNGGLAADAIADPSELRALTAFFAWTAWVSIADRPGSSHSYTNNFPYDPLAGNRPPAPRSCGAPSA
jgi:nitric oxide reductase subunit B